ncbi:hypothetical protein MBN61_02115, partial [Candidatus Saccharibacteria bacterium]|nr:hypothetical protein [Candidatus Saccharibacteria bacterium]
LCALEAQQHTSQPGGSEGNDDETKSEGWSSEQLSHKVPYKKCSDSAKVRYKKCSKSPKVPYKKCKNMA